MLRIRFSSCSLVKCDVRRAGSVVGRTGSAMLPLFVASWTLSPIVEQPERTIGLLLSAPTDTITSNKVIQDRWKRLTMVLPCRTVETTE